jgi:hypothetical protein
VSDDLLHGFVALAAKLARTHFRHAPRSKNIHTPITSRWMETALTGWKGWRASVFSCSIPKTTLTLTKSNYHGIAAGHSVNVNRAGTRAYLGNVGQHLVFYDAKKLDEFDRISTLRFEVNDTSLRGSTHAVWLNNHEFITAIGDFFYRFNINNLSKGEKLGPHKLKLPHAMKLTRSGRYLCYGSMDHPNYGRRGEAKEVGIWDMTTGEATRVKLPTTCWHLVTHPTKDLFYCVSFRVFPQDHVDYHEWAVAFLKEYAYEKLLSVVGKERTRRRPQPFPLCPGKPD